MRDKNLKYDSALRKELKVIERQEAALQRSADKQNPSKLKRALEDKVPQKVYENLQKAFYKAFQIVFEKGTGIIEKTYNRDSIQEDYEINEFAFQLKANHKVLRKLKSNVMRSNMKNMTIAGLDGIGLGTLGIGLPDIFNFVGLLLRGIYEVALHYGFDYDSEEERYFILKLIETSMKKGESWTMCNQEVVSMIENGFSCCSDMSIDSAKLQEQIRKTSDSLSVDMLVMKFLQGLPLAGTIGGAGNIAYYRKIMKYVEIMYRKRYLLERLQYY